MTTPHTLQNRRMRYPELESRYDLQETLGSGERGRVWVGVRERGRMKRKGESVCERERGRMKRKGESVCVRETLCVCVCVCVCVSLCVCEQVSFHHLVCRRVCKGQSSCS